jgi:folate-binding protein YgfZ
MHRIGLGIPECGKDYVPGEVFPHEAMLDRLNGVSFAKGCYVGQEIVSRMEHRGTARSRFLMVSGSGPLPPRGTEIATDETPIGTMGSSVGERGLALVRLDRLTDALQAGKPVKAGGVTLTFAKPAYATLAIDLPPSRGANA